MKRSIGGLAIAALLTAAPAFGADRGNSENAHENAPGQQRQEDQPAGAPPHAGGGQGQHGGQGDGGSTRAERGPRRDRGESHGRPAPRGDRPGPTLARPAPARGRPPHAGRPADTPGHRRKRGAPADNGAPKAPGERGMAHRKTTICHATGSATNPYVRITISDAALPAHARHQDGRDIIPAPAGDCPGAAVPAGPADRSGVASQPPAPGAPPMLGDTLPATAAPVDEAKLRVRPAYASAPRRAEAGTAPAAAEPAGGSLPFTGFESLLLAMAGMTLMLGGAGLWRWSNGV